MTWQANIIYRYRIDEKGITIISDYTGILSHPGFLGYLAKVQKPFIVVNKASAILARLTEPDLLIIVRNTTVPTFISNKHETYSFKYADIPLNGDGTLFAKIDLEDAVRVLNYISSSNPHWVISEYEWERTLREARTWTAKMELSQLKEELLLKLQQQPSLERIVEIAKIWSEIQYRSYLLADNSFVGLAEKMDEWSNPWFENGTWQEAFFAAASKPKTVDKLVHKMKQDKAPRKALLCFDCMGLPEWLLLKDYLSDLKLSFEESTVFALMPSITSISRTAIFAGTWEVYNKSNPGQYAEEKDFKELFGAADTIYLRESDFKSADITMGYKTVSVLFKFFDDLSHAAVVQQANQTKFNYYNAVLDYLKNSKVKQIIQQLLNEGFTLYICSDHGSTNACGNGRHIDKYLHDKFAKRGTIIPKDAAELVNEKKIAIPFVSDKLLVIPQGREMFADKGKLEINHGGITLDEMVVPFIKIETE